MKKIYFFLLSLVVFCKCFSADVLSDDKEAKVNHTIGAAAVRNETSKTEQDIHPLRLVSLDPKRSGSWYTEYEIGQAASMLQGVRQKDEFLGDRSASIVKEEQLTILTNHFGEKRGKKIYYSIIAQETSMTATDVKKMKKFVKHLHSDDQKIFRKYISGIKKEIPTVDRKNMKENARRCEGNETNEDNLSFLMMEDRPFVLAIRNGQSVWVTVLTPRFPNGAPVLVREGAFVLRGTGLPNL